MKDGELKRGAGENVGTPRRQSETSTANAHVARYRERLKAQGADAALNLLRDGLSQPRPESPIERDARVKAEIDRRTSTPEGTRAFMDEISDRLRRDAELGSTDRGEPRDNERERLLAK